MTFEDFDLNAGTVRALARRGIQTPTPIQAAALPAALAGRDVLGLARTGTGKTLAFALPIAARLEPASARGRLPRALVLAPTRELALQVARELAQVAPHLVGVTVYGGTGYQAQARALSAGADYVVATPGRARDYQKQGVLRLDAAAIVVLDEADEMLKAGFEEDVEALLGATAPGRQTLMFSATLPVWARRLARRHLKDPVVANVLKDEAVAYREEVYRVPRDREEALSRLLFAKDPERSIVFVRTKVEAARLADRLASLGHPARAVHGDLGQRDRERVLQAFRQGRTRHLVATDVAARGLDVPEVDLVVHYQLPDQPEAYQHRSGRTARAGRSGTVAIFAGGGEAGRVRRIEAAVGRRFARAELPGDEAARTARLRRLVEAARAQPEARKAQVRAIAEAWIKAGDVETLAGLLAERLLPEEPESLPTRRPGRRRVGRR